jgi:prephenate dehydrogenase
MKRSSRHKPEIAIIGYGRFGKLAAHYLKKDFNVFVFEKKNTHIASGIKKVSLREAAQKQNILLAVPINQLKAVLHAITPSLPNSALVIDVCSVKEQPLKWMKSILPKHVSILGTHPLFGPDSAQKTYRGKSIVLCPERISAVRIRMITKALRKRGLNVVQMTPQQHDRLMASTLFLTQFIGRGISTLALPSPKAVTENYALLYHVMQSAIKDTEELFQDMYRYNRYAHLTTRNVLQAFKRLQSRLAR